MNNIFKIMILGVMASLITSCSWIPQAKPIEVTTSTSVLPPLPELTLPSVDLQDITYSVLSNEQIQSIYRDMLANPNKKIVLFVLDENTIKAIEYNFAQFGLYIDAVQQRQKALNLYQLQLQQLQDKKSPNGP